MKAKKITSILLSLALLVTSMGIGVFAEDNEPVVENTTIEEQTTAPEEVGEVVEPEGINPANAVVSGSVKNLTVDFSWPVSSGDVTGIVLVVKNGETPVAEVNLPATASTYKLTGKGLVSGTDYSYTITANKEIGKEEYSGTFKADNIDAPTNVATKVSQESLIIVTWTAVPGATKYALLNGSKVLVDNIDAAATTVNYLQPAAGKYNYVVRAYKDGVYNDSAVSAVTLSNSFNYTTSAYYWYAKLKKKTTVYKKATGSKKLTTLKKGTKVICVGRYPSRVKKFKSPKRAQIQLSNGSKGWIQYSMCKGGAKLSTNVSKRYSKAVAEDYVNNVRKLTSPTKKLLWLSVKNQRVYIFNGTGAAGSWKYDRCFRTTTGKFSNPTDVGLHQLKKRKAKVNKKTDKGVGYYFRYGSFFTTGNSFHSGCYYMSGKTKNVVQKNGQPKTMGCVRMYLSDAKWIYNNCPLKSTVCVSRE